MSAWNIDFDREEVRALTSNLSRMDYKQLSFKGQYCVWGEGRGGGGAMGAGVGGLGWGGCGVGWNSSHLRRKTRRRNIYIIIVVILVFIVVVRPDAREDYALCDQVSLQFEDRDL